MTISLSAPRSLLLPGPFIGAFPFGAAAQQPAAPAAGAAPAAAPALPPGSPLIGRPDGEAAAKLAPVAGPPLARPPRAQPAAGAGPAARDRRRQIADRQTQGARGLQHRGLCRRHG